MPNYIIEDTDVMYYVCRVWENPPAHETVWRGRSKAQAKLALKKLQDARG